MYRIKNKKQYMMQRTKKNVIPPEHILAYFPLQNKSVTCTEAAQVVPSLYGSVLITEPVLLDILACSTMQRLQLINQYGASALLKYGKKYTRYDHSIGVFVLLRNFKRELPEQIAGLLHDVSHTIFSHVAEYLFDHHDDSSSYQDKIHEWFLQQTEIPEILHHHGIATKDILHKNKNFIALEAELPHLCADRLDYVLYGGVLDGILSLQNMQKIVQAIQFDQEHRWYFNDVESANLFAQLSLHLTEHHFGAIQDMVLTYLTGQLLRYALSIQLLTLHDIHFSTDAVVWNILCKSNDATIKDFLEKINSSDTAFMLSTPPHADKYFKPKFRGIDPVVRRGMNSFYRLTELDQHFSTEFYRVKMICQNGFYIKFV